MNSRMRVRASATPVFIAAHRRFASTAKQRVRIPRAMRSDDACMHANGGSEVMELTNGMGKNIKGTGNAFDGR